MLTIERIDGEDNSRPEVPLFPSPFSLMSDDKNARRLIKRLNDVSYSWANVSRCANLYTAAIAMSAGR